MAAGHAMTTTLRTDIQALRGYAVLVVVLYHVGMGPFEAGFLGVDIFFVVSGFLITTLIAKGIQQGSFSLAIFYARRAKRLLPAAYTVILATAIAAPWFIDQEELAHFAWQVVGAVTFTANLVFWWQTDYFGSGSELKLLLHTWSLSVEEQYYLLLPALLMLLRPSRWLQAVVALLITSLAVGVVGALFKPVVSFYSLPTRAWELLIGSVGALYVLRTPVSADLARRTARRLFVPALVLLLCLPAVRLPGPHPGAAALTACLATLTLILAQHPLANESSVARVLAWWGDRSYSLYLVHWPLFALMHNAWAGAKDTIPLSLRIGALLLSLALAWLLHRYVEDPVRRSPLRLTRPVLLGLGASSALLVAVTPAVIALSHTDVDYRALRRVNFGLDRACDYRTPFQEQAACQTSPKPEMIVWGDSFAMHVIPGLAPSAQGGLVQATATGCGPFVGLAPQQRVRPETGIAYDRVWAESCLAFNRSVLDHLRNADSVHTVVLSSLLTAYAGDEAWLHVVERADGTLAETRSNAAEALLHLRRTAEELRRMGKRVVLVAPPPVATFNVGGCWERQQTGRVTLGVPAGCKIDKAEYMHRRAGVLAFLGGAEAAGIPVIRFEEALCDALSCLPEIDGTLIYRDSGHFTHSGSALVAKRVDLVQQINERAR